MSTEVLAFNKWSTQGIKIEDPGLIDYINLQSRLVPKTGAKYAGKRFHKSKTFIVERLMNKLAVPGHK
ncbi:30S ribosomal protein S7, partial [Candidatus Woesearchaeota archaeon]|nr:30S ribosomal protein S7 [Candidatus Woesearchaeota archaeon]